MIRMGRSILLLLLLLGCSALLRAEDPLAAFNALFREAYAQAKADSTARQGAVLMVAGDKLTLYRNGAQAAQAVIRPAQYHRLKAVAHVPLALQVLLSGPAPEPGRIRTLRALVGRARAGLGDGAPGRSWRGSSRSWTPASRCWTTRRVREAWRQVGWPPSPKAWAPCSWPTPTPPRAWNWTPWTGSWAPAPGDGPVGLARPAGGDHRLAHGPGRGGRPCSTSAASWASPGRGDRIVYAEGLWRPRDALDLLATHRVDGAAGAAFFGDPMRMHRDILADGARPGWMLIFRSPVH